jgi:hypothetical protein
MKLRRREFMAGLGGAAAWPLAVNAQQTKPTIGWVTDALPPRDVIDAFRRGLAGNLSRDNRFGSGCQGGDADHPSRF